MHKYGTPYCAVSYVIGYFSYENPINYKEDGLLYCIQLKKTKVTLQMDKKVTLCKSYHYYYYYYFLKLLLYFLLHVPIKYLFTTFVLLVNSNKLKKQS